MFVCLFVLMCACVLLFVIYRVGLNVCLCVVYCAMLYGLSFVFVLLVNVFVCAFCL